jgi:hypothetical protein
MIYVIALCVIISLSCTASILTRRKFEEVLPLSFFLIIIVLYICGLCGGLLTGIYILFFLSFICLCCSGYYVAKHHNVLLSQIVTPGFVAFLVLAALFFISSTGRFMVMWDEFSHWGLVVKNMYYFDALGNYKDATTYFKGYPPATALLEYFFVRLKTPFEEPYLFRAMDLFLVSLVLPVFRLLDWKRWKQGLPIFFIVLILPLIFYPNIYNTVYVDGFLGLLFAYMLFSYFYSNKQDYFTYLNLGATGCILVLTKASGTGLAAIAFLIILFDMLRYQRDEIHSFVFTHNTTLKKNIKWQNLAWLLFPIAVTFFGKCSWSVYLKITHTEPAWNTSNVTFKGIAQLFTKDAPEYRFKTIHNFFSALVNMFYKDGTFKMSYLLWILILILFILVICALIGKDRREKKRFIAFGIGIIIGFCIYAVSLLILYLFTYAVSEALGLASFSRYMNTYLLGSLELIAFCVIAHSFSSNRKLAPAIPAIILCVLIPLVPLKNVVKQYFSSEYKVSYTYVQRLKYKKIEQLPLKLNVKSDKVYFVSQNSNGIDYWIARYSVTPMQISPAFTWSLTAPGTDGVEMSVQMSAKSWAEELKKEYTYVYLFSVDDNFKKEYGCLFENIDVIQNDTLYSINKSGSSIVLRFAKT